VWLYGLYKERYFNGFIKAENISGASIFTRDNKVKNGYPYSYKIESKDFNDAVFYKEIKVKPNTPYKVKCMVKTENVKTPTGKTDGGAQISIIDSTECSDIITGTNDWKELDFMFNSKNRDIVKIGFRLGGNKESCNGTAWFSDFSLEQGIATTDTNWNMACFIFKNVDVQINKDGIEQNLKISMTNSDISIMQDNMNRFKNSCKELSNNQMTVTYDTYIVDEPITSISYSDDYGYYVDPMDVKDILEKYIGDKEYDHIFVCVRFGDLQKNEQIPVNDWIGLRSEWI